MEQYLGEIRLFGFSFAPVGWALCNGQFMAISQNAALFALLGTTYGGNGTDTFALPNLQSRVPIHMGQGTDLSPYLLGQFAGMENVTLNSQQMPLHNHQVSAAANNGDQTSPIGSIHAQVNNAATPRPAVYPGYTQQAATGAMLPSMITNAGGNEPHSNVQPYLVVNFCIAIQGTFPPRP